MKYKLLYIRDRISQFFLKIKIWYDDTKKIGNEYILNRRNKK